MVEMKLLLKLVYLDNFLIIFIFNNNLILLFIMYDLVVLKYGLEGFEICIGVILFLYFKL